MSWALVTGAAKRLGRAVALYLAHNGWSIAAHYRGSDADAMALQREIETLGGEVALLRADLGKESEIVPLMQQAQNAAGGALTALVNCAATFEHDTIETLTTETVDRHMHLNALAPSMLARAFGKALGKDARGAVVNFLDFKLASPYPDHFSYTLSKYALAGATDLLARALAPQVRVNAVAPGYVLAAPGQSDADYKRLHEDTPLEYGPTPEDVAHAVRFLIENPAVTGQTIFVDAGRRFRSFDRDMAFM